jgi:hypothetical protein
MMNIFSATDLLACIWFLLWASFVGGTGDTSEGIYKNTNVILILADDLGYGDLGFGPFNSALMKNVRTPELEKLARRGMTLTNFHAASPICSPSRASIMVVVLTI